MIFIKKKKESEMTDSMDEIKKLLSYKDKEVASVRLKFKQ